MSGILWVKFQCHDNASNVLSGLHVLFDRLGCQYSSLDFICVCGDFNARCGNHQGVLDFHGITQGQICDTGTNSHSLQLIDFLRSLGLCMLNGRGKDYNYTYISSMGSSVVYYCLVAREEFDSFDNFEVVMVADLERDLNYINKPASTQFSHGNFFGII